MNRINHDQHDTSEEAPARAVRSSNAIRSLGIVAALSLASGSLLGWKIASGIEARDSKTTPAVTFEQEEKEKTYEQILLSAEEALEAKTIVADWINTNHPGAAETDQVDLTIKTVDHELNLIVNFIGRQEEGPVTPYQVHDFSLSSKGVVGFGSEFAMPGNTIPPQLSMDLINGFSVFVGPENTKIAPDELLMPPTEDRHLMITEGFESSEAILGSPASQSNLYLIETALR